MAEEIKKASQDMTASVSTEDSSVELSKDELQGVAGGNFLTDIGSEIGGAAEAVGGAVAGAAEGAAHGVAEGAEWAYHNPVKAGIIIGATVASGGAALAVAGTGLATAGTVIATAVGAGAAGGLGGGAIGGSIGIADGQDLTKNGKKVDIG